MKERDFAKDYLIFKCLAGSHAYGTSLPTSDRDERGVFIAPPDFVLSCMKSIGQIEHETEDDVVFELRKFIKLAAECNPNIIELLFSDEENILFIDWPFKLLRDNRHLFLSKKAKFTFSGYAMSQMKRIKGHHKWISNPQGADPPNLSAFCRFIGNDGRVVRDPDGIRALQKECFLAETFGQTQFRVYKSPIFFKDKLGFFNDNETDVRFVNVSDDILSSRAEYVGFMWVNFDEFKQQHRDWKQYWEWKKNRNPIRAAMEAESGYDRKHAMHLVRLMRMAEEILTLGEVRVRRADAKELLEIRHGRFDYDWLIKWSEDMDNKLNEVYETSPLRHSADHDAIDSLYREIITTYWRKKGLLNL